MNESAEEDGSENGNPNAEGDPDVIEEVNDEEDDVVPEHLSADEKDGDAMGDSAPDLMSEDDCRVVRRTMNKPDRYNPSSGKSYHMHAYSEKEICHNLITQGSDPKNSFEYDDGEEKVLAAIM